MEQNIKLILCDMIIRKDDNMLDQNNVIVINYTVFSTVMSLVCVGAALTVILLDHPCWSILFGLMWCICFSMWIKIVWTKCSK